MNFTKVGWFVAIGIVSVLVVAVVSQTLHAQNDARLGTWKLNLKKSTFNPGPAPKSQTRTYEQDDKGVKVSVKGVRADGNPVSYGFTSNSDGQESPISGTGPYGADTIVLKRVDASTVTGTLKKAGKVVEVVRSEVSADGKILTISTSGTDATGQEFKNVAVFDKQ